MQQATAERDAANAATEADAHKRTTIALANKSAAIQDAEAAATDAKAMALKKYGQAAIAQEVISRLPEIVRAAAEPIGNIANMTEISTDGASSLTKSVASVLGRGRGSSSSSPGWTWPS